MKRYNILGIVKTVLALGCLIFSGLSLNAAEDKAAEGEAAADFSSIYFLSSLKSGRDAPAMIYGEFARGGKPAEGLFELVAIQKKSEAETMKYGLLLQATFDRYTARKVGVRTDKKSANYILDVLFGKLKLDVIKDGKWKTFATKSCDLKDMRKFHSYLEQLNWAVLNMGLNVKCSAKKSKDSKTVTISGKVVNNFPFDVAGVKIAAPVPKDIPAQLKGVEVAAELKAGETKEFSLQAEASTHVEMPMSTDKGEDLGLYSDDLLYIWRKAFVMSARLAGAEAPKEEKPAKKIEGKKEQKKK